ncbi:MAG: hypothetical protein ACP5XB_21675 [Isosphaeraceae bacterium]
MNSLPRRTGAFASACYIGSALFLSVGMLALGDQPLGANESLEWNCKVPPNCGWGKPNGTHCPTGSWCYMDVCRYDGCYCAEAGTPSDPQRVACVGF